MMEYQKGTVFEPILFSYILSFNDLIESIALNDIYTEKVIKLKYYFVILLF